MTELILPDGYSQPPRLEPIDSKSCEMVRVAANVLAGYVDDLGGPSDELGTTEGEITLAHNSIATACGQVCTRECGLWTDVSAERIGIEVPVSAPERSRRDTVIRTVSLLIENDDFVLDPAAQHLKGMVERRLEMADPKTTLAGPQITDKAYQQMANLAEGNHTQELKILGRLYNAAQISNLGIDDTSFLVTPEDPSVITAADVRRLYLHPDLQNWLRISKTPRSQITSAVSR